MSAPRSFSEQLDSVIVNSATDRLCTAAADGEYQPMHPSLHASDEIVIGAYVALLIAMGVVMKRLNHDLSDYFRNGCRGTWWLVGASAFMTSFSAGTFTGIAGIAFNAGWTVTVIFAANALGFLLNYAFLAAWFRQLRATTSPEVICMRFGTSTQQMYAWIGVLSRLLYAAMQLYGLGLFAAAIFGLNIHAVIWVTGCTVMFLSAVGGSWAVTSSDFLQSLVLIPITILVAVLALGQFGGFSGLMHAIDVHGLTKQFQLVKPGTGRFPLTDYTWPWVAAIVVKMWWATTRYFGRALFRRERRPRGTQGRAARRRAHHDRHGHLLCAADRRSNPLRKAGAGRGDESARRSCIRGGGNATASQQPAGRDGCCNLCVIGQLARRRIKSQCGRRDP